MPPRSTADDINRLVSRQDLDGLIVALESDDMSTRWMAAGGLGELRDPRAIDPLIRTLTDPDPDVRWKAAEALGSIGDLRAVEVLIPLLSDPDGTMRLQVAWALGKIRAPHAVTHLIPFLTDPDYDMKIATIWALGAIGDIRATGVLREMLLDRHPGIRSKVAESLERCGWRPADDRERGALAFARRDWKEVSRYGRALGDVLIWALDDRYFDVRMHAARILGMMKSRHAVAPLHRALDDPEECVTYEAAAALAEIGNPASKKGLIYGLASPHLSTRKVAAGALTRLGWEPRSLYHKILFMSATDDWIGLVKLRGHGVDPLARELAERQGMEREGIAKALKAIGSPATDALVRLLKNPDPDIRWRAASILGDAGDERAVGPLILALTDADVRVVTSAAVALGELRNDTAVDPLIQAWRSDNPDLRRDAITALGKIGSPRAADVIIEASGDENRDIRLSAVRAMGLIGGARMLPVLIPFFQDPDPALRLEAVQAIRTYHGQETDRLLTGALGDSDARVRQEAARRVGRRRVATAVGPLVRLFEDPDTGVRKAAARALERIGWKPSNSRERLAYLIAKEEWEEIQRLGLMVDPAKARESDRPALIPGGLQDRVLRPAPPPDEQILPEDQEVDATPSGGKENDVDAHDEVPDLEYFVGVLNNPDADVQSRIKAAEALGSLGDLRGVRPLMNALRDPDAEVRACAALSLGMLGDSRAFGSLAVALEDPVFEVKRRAAEALPALGSRSAVTPLADLAKSPDPGDRMLAIRVLGDFEDVDAVRALLVALNDTHPDVKSAVMESLLGLSDYWGSRTSLFLRDTDPVIRENVITALRSLFGEETASSRLLPLLRSGSFSVRLEAIRALQAMGWQPDRSEEYAMAMVADGRWDEVVALGKQAEDTLIAALFDTDREIQDGAVAALARIGDAGTVRSIRTILQKGGDLKIKGIYAAMKAASLIEAESQKREDGDGPIPPHMAI